MLGLGAAFSIRNNARYTTSGMIAVQPAPAVAAQQQHKLAVEQHAGFQLAVFHLRSHELLIVPVAHDSGYYWPRRGLWKKPGTIHVVIGAPIEAAGRNPREVNAEAQSWIEEHSTHSPTPVRYQRPREET